MPNFDRPSHDMQLFDDDESLGATVSAFVREGLRDDAVVLLVATPPHRDMVLASLDADCSGIDRHVARQSLVIRDAEDTLRLFMRRGRPDAVLFDETVSTLVQQLADRGRGLRIYGEMVDILAAEGQLREAMQLEELWNELGQRVAFDLFCGYSASSFGHPRDGAVLGQICRSHSHVHSHPRDVLGSYLLSAHAKRVESAAPEVAAS